MAEHTSIPDDATRVSICPCGAAAWTTGDGSSADDQQWFDDFDAAHADCVTEVPTFGYVADERDFFIRALDAKILARENAIYPTDDLDARREVAALAYADAVYQVEAAKVRAA